MLLVQLLLSFLHVTNTVFIIIIIILIIIISGEHSLTVWDSSIVLIKYFERHIHWFRKLLSSNSNKNDSDNNKRSVCVELGAGTGALPSLAAAIIAHNTNSNDNDKNDIYQKPLLIITDQVQVLPFTRRNLEVNIGQIRVNNDDNNGSRNMKMMPEYCVMEMDWTKKSDVQQVIDTISRKTELNSSCQKNHSEDHDHETNTNTTEKNSDNNSDFNRPNNNTPHVDVVLASDCVYNESLIQPFINTIEAISDEKTVILIAHEKRCEVIIIIFKRNNSDSAF